MIEPRPDIVAAVRSMGRAGRPPSEMLRIVMTRHQPEQLHPTELMEYFREAFRFRDGQGSPIHGWFPDGQGELDDAKLDALMNRRIERNRAAWKDAA